MLCLKSKRTIIYKVARRNPALSIADTMIFKDKQQAMLQLHAWLKESQFLSEEGQ